MINMIIKETGSDLKMYAMILLFVVSVCLVEAIAIGEIISTSFVILGFLIPISIVSGFQKFKKATAK